MKSIELIMKVGDMCAGSIFIVSDKNYYNEDGSFTIENIDKKLILKKSLFKGYGSRLLSLN